MRNYLFLVLLLLVAGGAVSVHAQESLYTCEDDNCVDIFNSSDVTITAIRALSSYAYFQNPLLEMEIRMERSAPTERNLYLAAPQRLFPDGNSHCDLLLVGLADTSGRLQRLIPVPAGETDERLEVYAFCRNINLPGVEAGFPPFPGQATMLNPDNIEPVTDNPQALIQIVNRARSGTCTGGTWENQPDSNRTPEPFTIGLNSLATQFAVFILYADAAQRDDIWQQFLLEANTRVYKRDFDAIYGCLLQSVAGISRPQPTPTPTPTLTPTPFFEPSPTPTAIPLINRQVIAVEPLNQSVSPVQLALALGVIITGIVAMMIGFSLLSIQRFRRAAIIILFVAILVILIYSWLNGLLTLPLSARVLS